MVVLPRAIAEQPVKNVVVKVQPEIPSLSRRFRHSTVWLQMLALLGMLMFSVGILLLKIKYKFV
jgi:hypothetical protein